MTHKSSRPLPLLCSALLCSVLRFVEGPYTHVVRNVLIDHAQIERTVRPS